MHCIKHVLAVCVGSRQLNCNGWVAVGHAICRDSAEMNVISGCVWVPHGLFLYYGAIARDTFPPNYLASTRRFVEPKHDSKSDDDNGEL
jgi:hypothetical protein